MLVIIIIIIIIIIKTKVIPAIKGATGAISKSFKKYVSNIPGNHEVKELTENSHIRHCTYISESANVEIQWS
jgi:Sec-independent protein translocase protein TatA